MPLKITCQLKSSSPLPPQIHFPSFPLRSTSSSGPSSSAHTSQEICMTCFPSPPHPPPCPQTSFSSPILHATSSELGVSYALLQHAFLPIMSLTTLCCNYQYHCLNPRIRHLLSLLTQHSSLLLFPLIFPGNHHSILNLCGLGGAAQKGVHITQALVRQHIPFLSPMTGSVLSMELK